MKSLLLALLLFSALPSFAGVYGTLEFGDDRATVTQKLKKSKLVDQTITTALMGRTGLNGIFKCKAKLAGLTYRLYFDWDENGGLKEITLRSEPVEKQQYKSIIYKAWQKANNLFTNVYSEPVQNADYPDKTTLSDGGMYMTHVWHKSAKQSILMGPGQDMDKYFLAIRFVNQRIEPVKIKKQR